MAGDRPAVDTLWQVTVEGPEAVAAAAADALAAASDPAALSTQLFEQPDMTWRASALYAAEPDADALADILLDHVSGDAVAVEVVPPRDWVADSVKSLEPVLAGRFAVAIPERARDVQNGTTPIVVEAAQAIRAPPSAVS